MRRAFSLLPALLLCVSVARADELRSPLTSNATGLALDVEGVLALSVRDSVTLTDLPLPDGTRVALDLRRVGVEAATFVDGAPAPDLLGRTAWSAWRGTVAGVADSDVALGFSLVGCHGWVRVGDELWHLAGRAGPLGDWSRPELRFVTDAELARLGLRAPTCGQEQLVAVGGAPAAQATQPSTAALGSSTIYEARLAIECDYEYFLVFGDSSAATVYVATLFSWVSALYEQQVGVVFTIPYLNIWTTINDPWSAGTGPGENCIDRIYEFQAAWMGNVPEDADIGHMMSGVNMGCAAGFLGGLCSPTQNFSVSTSATGGTPFPVTPNNANIDFYAATHELGHNFGAIHTHAYCPPLDECATAGYFGPCQTQQQCTYPGTLMSYCHVCGGFANVGTVFHPQSALDMRAHVEAGACLSVWCPPTETYCSAQANSDGCVPMIATLGQPTLAGPDDFHVLASDVLAGQNGLLFYGFDEAAIPIASGLVCILPPLVRADVIGSGGSGACGGLFDFHWSQAFLANQSLAVGTTVYAQFWYRDPASTFGSGLTDAVRFTVCQ